MNLKSILLKITADPEDAQRKLADVVQDLREFALLDVQARADVQTEAAKAKLEKLKAQFIAYSKQEPAAAVKIRMGRTLEQIERLEAKLAELDGRQVDVEVNVRRSLVDRAEQLGGRAGETIANAGPTAAVVPAAAGLTVALSGVAAGAAALGVAALGALGPIGAVIAATVQRAGELKGALSNLKAAFAGAFGRAATAVLAGVRSLLAGIVRLLSGRGVSRALSELGAAMARMLRAIGRTLGGAEMRRGFIELTQGATRLVRAFGSRVFGDFLKLFMRLATAAMPALLRVLGPLVDKLDGLANGTRNTRQLREQVTGAIEQFRSLIGDLATGARAFLTLGKIVAPILGAIATGFGYIATGVKAIIGLFSNRYVQAAAAVILGIVLALTGVGEAAGIAFAAVRAFFAGLSLLQKIIAAVAMLGALGGAFRAVGRAAARLASTVGAYATRAVQAIRDGLAAGIGTVGDIGRRIAGAFGTAIGAVTGFARTAWRDVIDFLTGKLDAAAGMGRSIGRAIARGFHAAIGGIVGIAKSVLNALITVLNSAIRGINKITPGKISLPGPIPDIPGIPDIPEIPKLALGALLTGPTVALAGEAGPEMVLPLTRADVMARIGQSIAAAIPAPAQLAFAGGLPAPGSGAAAARIGRQENHVHVSTPSGELPDGRYVGAQITRELERMGRG